MLATLTITIQGEFRERTDCSNGHHAQILGELRQDLRRQAQGWFQIEGQEDHQEKEDQEVASNPACPGFLCASIFEAPDGFGPPFGNELAQSCGRNDGQRVFGGKSITDRADKQHMNG